MRRKSVLIAFAAGLTLLVSGPATALDTQPIDPTLLPPDPLVVTDAELATAGASPGTQQLVDDPNLIVDDDLAQCPNADFTTAAGIQAAIEAAAPAAKIRVCPGNYSPINVHKADLWLQAPRTHGGANQCHEGSPAQDAIIEGSHALGLVQIVASGVRFEGFTVQGNSSGPGIRTDSAGSGYEITFNEIRLNHYGVDLNSDGLATTVLSHNCIRNNAGLGSGVLSSSGFSDVVFEHNFFTGHRCVSISNLLAASAATCTAPFVPVADVRVEHNSFIEDTTAGFDGGTNVVMNSNEWLSHFGVAVSLNNVVGAEVSHNHIDGQAAQSEGIIVNADEGVALDTVIRSNKIENLQGGFSGTFQFFGFAIRVQSGLDVDVSQNWIQFNRGTGIYLRPRADGSVVHGNLLVGNGVPGTDALPVQSGSDGIRVAAGSTGNLIENNRLGEPLQGSDPEERANRDHDCHDDNPAGTNVWRHNVGYTENQPGLCVKRTT